ncbi:MAG: HlyD family efflux transporter periplasmic adaptor subunit [Sandaracinaceae bacterium]
MSEQPQDPGRDALQFDPGSAAWVTSELVARPPSRWSRLVLYGMALAVAGGVVAAARIEVPRRVSMTGRVSLEPAAVEARALSGGRVQEVVVSRGRRVARGEALVRLERDVGEEARARIQRLVRRPRPGAHELEADLAALEGRRDDLARAGLLSAVERVAAAARDRVEADLQVALARLAEEADRNRQRFVVPAPIDGLVRRVDVRAGAIVPAGAPCATVAPPESAWTARVMSSEHAARVREGSAVRLTSDGLTAPVEGRVRACAREASSADLECVVTIPSPPEGLPDGAEVMAEVDAGRATLLSVISSRLAGPR